MSTVVSDCFTIGSIVATRTCYDEDIEGEVLAFDPQTKMLILKCASSSGNPKRHDVNIVNLSLVSDVQIKKEVTAVPDPPASLNLHRLNTRVRNSIENKRRLVSTLHIFINDVCLPIEYAEITEFRCDILFFACSILRVFSYLNLCDLEMDIVWLCFVMFLSGRGFMFHVHILFIIINPLYVLLLCTSLRLGCKAARIMPHWHKAC